MPKLKHWKIQGYHELLAEAGGGPKGKCEGILLAGDVAGGGGGGRCPRK